MRSGEVEMIKEDWLDTSGREEILCALHDIRNGYYSKFDPDAVGFLARVEGINERAVLILSLIHI